MKIKSNVLCLVAVSIAILPMTFLAACENTPNDPIGLGSVSGILDPGNMSGNGQSGESSQDTSGTSSVAEDKSTVTSEEWDAAFAKSKFENCTVTFTGTGDGDVITMVLKAAKGENRYSMFTSDVYNGETHTSEAVAAKIGESYYGYSKSGEGAWSRSEITEEQFNSSFDNVFDEFLLVAEFSGKFDEFSYDQTEKTYKAEDMMIDGATCAVTVTMKNDNVAAITINAVMDEREYDYSVTVTEYGTTTIDIPQTDNGQSTDSANE